MFKKGQKVRVIKADPDFKVDKEYLGKTGVIFNDDYLSPFPYLVEFEDGRTIGFKENQLELITNQKEVSMPPIYILKKETHNLKKGAVLEPDGCYENGNYWYVPQDKADIKFPFKDRDLLVSKGQAEKQPEWFEKVELVPVPSNKMAQVKKILKGK